MTDTLKYCLQHYSLMAVGEAAMLVAKGGQRLRKDKVSTASRTRLIYTAPRLILDCSAQHYLRDSNRAYTVRTRSNNASHSSPEGCGFLSREGTRTQDHQHVREAGAGLLGLQPQRA